MKDLTDLFISAYPEMRSATFALQRAGISRAAINENQPVAKYWQEALAFVDTIEAVADLVRATPEEKAEALAARRPLLARIETPSQRKKRA